MTCLLIVLDAAYAEIIPSSGSKLVDNYRVLPQPRTWGRPVEVVRTATTWNRDATARGGLIRARRRGTYDAITREGGQGDRGVALPMGAGSARRAGRRERQRAAQSASCSCDSPRCSRCARTEAPKACSRSRFPPPSAIWSTVSVALLIRRQTMSSARAVGTVEWFDEAQPCDAARPRIVATQVVKGSRRPRGRSSRRRPRCTRGPRAA